MPAPFPNGCARWPCRAPSASARTLRSFERRAAMHLRPHSSASSWKWRLPPIQRVASPCSARLSARRSIFDRRAPASEPRNVGEWQLVVMHDHPAELGATAELGEDLARIEQVVGIEGAFHAHLLVEIDLGELLAHQVALLDADAVLAGQHAADAHAEPEDIGAEFLGAAELARIVGVEQDQRVEVAVAGMEDIDHA